MDGLRIGIVGAGGIAVEHAKGWQANAPRGAIAAIADVTAERAQALADRFTGGTARVYQDYEALVADAAVDAVDICLPHHLHTEAIVAAARAGKAVLCEKPLSTAFEDAAVIDAALRETGVVFMAAHNQLFQPSLVEARQVLAAGVLGRPFVLRSMEAFQHRDFRLGRVASHQGSGESPWAWRIDPRKMGGGTVIDTGWHATYRILALADERPVEVAAMTDRFYVHDLPAEDTGALLVRFASGAIGQIFTSWACAPIGNWQFEVMAENGSLAGGGVTLVHQLHGWPHAAERTFEPTHTVTAEIKHFLDVVQRGVPNLAPFEQSARALQLTTAAYRAAAERRSMTLPDDPLAPPEPATTPLS